MAKEQFALITGATSGIGYELAKLFARDGYNLVLVARNEEMLSKTASELKGWGDVTIHTIAADLFKPEGAKQVYDKTKSLGVSIEYLVNDAGQGEWGRFFKTDLQRDIDLVQLNIISLMSLTKYYLHEMVERNSGRILQLASSLAKAPTPYMAVYAASKAFVLHLSEALVKELEDTDVTVTALLPGATDTDFFHKAKAEGTTIYNESSLYDPAEVAEAGYKAMMNGESTVQPGLKNKAQNVLSTILPDSAVASNMEKQMESSMEEEGKTAIAHAPSAREREAINAASGGVNGDYETRI